MSSADSDYQEERNDCVIYKSNKNPQLLDRNTSNSENRKMGDNVIIDIANETSAYGNEFDIWFTEKAENLNSSSVDLCSAPLLSPEEDNIFIEESHTTIDNSSPQENDTFNKFLNELYEKELDLHNKFSDEEIGDICAAVKKQVNVIVKRIYEIDSRLKIQDVLLVGSAREGTQIIRPCEYDFILTLEALSKPGTVSITPEDPEGNSREYMRVKLEDDDVRSVFHEFSENGNIIATRLLPWNRQGLRDLFSTTVRQAIMLCSRSWVVMDTGKLKLKRRKPKKNGPACTISLLWERATTEKYTTMEISVDLCSALKVDFENYYSLLPSFDTSTSSSLHGPSFDSHDLNHAKSMESVLPLSNKAVSNDSDHSHSTGPLLSSSNCLVSNDLNHSQSTESVLTLSGNAISNDLVHNINIKSVLLMPRDGMRFKVAFTESELLLTSDLSEHHRKCNRLLKYIVNGEPFPLERSGIRRLVKDTHTCFQSYNIKRAVWEHHHIQHCNQDINLGICVTEILSKLKAEEAGLMHPFNKNRIIETSSENRDKLPLPADLGLGRHRLCNLTDKAWRLRNTPIDAYDYQQAKSDALSPVYCNGIWYPTLYLIFGFITIGIPLIFIIYKLSILESFPLPLFSLAVILNFGFFAYVMSARRVMYHKWRLLATPLSLCTKQN